MKKILALLLFFVVGAAGSVGYLALDFLNSTPDIQGEEQIFEVKPGESMRSVARRLEKQGLITSAFKFRVYSRLNEQFGLVRVGEYNLSSAMYPNDVLKVITSGASILRTITLQEGLNRYEIADMVGRSGIADRDEFFKLTEDHLLIKELLGEELPSFEGYLFPETYSYTKYTDGKALIKMMVEMFKKKFQEVESLKAITNLTRHEIVIFASIIEKETGAKHERPLISSVFHNRMKKGMRLQTDPTVLYGILDRTGKMPKNIRKADLRFKDRYNTYTFRGLPHGPISNPGFDSLKYTVRPQHTGYYYFVSRNDGTSQFSTNLKDHNRAVRKYQLNASARRGKSWRDLNKKQSSEN